MRNSNEVAALVNTARGLNFNAIIVEVRKRGDAYYNSTIEPKATDVSPQSYDPLADLLDKAHNGGRRIEVHAWITTYLAWNNQATTPTQPNHPFTLHPEWLSVDNTGANWDGSNYQFDQSLPEVQRYIYNVAMDIISRYDVDGFHFDYVRYSGRTWGYHSNAITRFNSRYNRAGTPGSTDAQWLQFRRDQISGLVRKIYLNAIALKPQVKISAATICFAPGVTTDAGWFSSSAAWTSVLQDWRGWMQEGILDLNIPMAYFRQHTHAADWSAWSTFAKERAYGHHVAIGQGSYLNYLTNVISQLRTTRVPTVNSNATAAGMAMYSYAVPSLDTSAAAFNALVNPSGYDTNPVPLFATPVDPPVMTWKTAPTLGHLKGTIRSAVASNELDGALVSIAGPVSAARTNDATGFYGFAHLPPGTYNVTASYSNLAGYSATVLITTGAVATLDFALGATNAAVFNVRAYPGEREAIVAWNTMMRGNSEVQFGATPNSGAWKAGWIDQSPVTNHVVLLTGLSPNTEYFFAAHSYDGTNQVGSPVSTFGTAGQIILDNPSAALAGTWTTGTASPDKYGSDYVFSSTAGNAATVTYTPPIATPGRYDVYVTYPQGGNRSTNAPFLLVYNGGTLTGAVNQTTGGGVWQLIAANRPFARGTSGYFQWRNQTAEIGKVVLADAVRFVYATNQEPAAPGAVPQWWSEFYFGGIVNATFDPDADGMSTAQEYIAGTDPRRASSSFRIRISDGTNGVLNTTAFISFAPFHSGRLYELQSKTTLGSNAWNMEPGAAQELSNTDGFFPVPWSGPGQKFYRLRVQRAP